MIKSKLFLYIFFALISTFANLITQRFILSINNSNLFFLTAVILGTFIGLLIKFFLDKKWIFNDISYGLENQTRKFSLYASMGLLTTIIFWSTETIFWFIWQTEKMREIGAILGLTIGYILKYKLDKNFVFKKRKY